VIHRDLKPSNVLVTLQNDTPIPKIIVFGVAETH
jgi:serine/threonine protein kinase